MTWWKALVLGTVQGLAEFLPISSSGHLVIFQRLLGVPDVGLAFDTFLHLGSLLAVLAFFRAEIVGLVRGFLSLIARVFGRRGPLDPFERLVGLIVLGSVPAALAGFKLEPIIERLFTSPKVVGYALWVTAGIMWGADRLGRRSGHAAGLSWWKALVVGSAQAVAIVPGISRSGSTIFAGLATGLSRTEAARFSFLLSIPVVLGAGATQIGKLPSAPGLNIGVIATGMVAAAVFGYLAIAALLQYVNKRGYTLFAYYCALAGLLVILFI